MRPLRRPSQHHRARQVPAAGAAQLLTTHPDVNIDLRERLSHDIVRAVFDGQTDIGIVAGSARTENLEVIPYRCDRLVVVVPQGHPLAALSAVAFADTLELDHVGLHEASALHAFGGRSAGRCTARPRCASRSAASRGRAG